MRAGFAASLLSYPSGGGLAWAWVRALSGRVTCPALARCRRQEQQLDQSLRQDMRAPDASTLIVVRKPDQQAVLEAAERLTAALAPVIRQGGLAGLDSPARYLPSMAMQRTRLAALPDAPTLQSALDAALDGLPFQPGLFAPFLADVAKARTLAPISRADLDGTSLSLRLDSLAAASSRWLGRRRCLCAA